MPYSFLKPGRLRLEDESTGRGYLFIQKDDEFLWCDSSETILQVLSCVKIGTLADRPTAGKKGRLYFATDTNELYYDDGSSWTRATSGDVGLYDADRDTYINVEPSADADKIVGYTAGTQILSISNAGILTLPKQSICVVYLATTQNISAGTTTKVQFDTVLIDTQNEFDSTNYRVTVSEDGKYLVFASTDYLTSYSGDRFITSLYINGTEKAETRFESNTADDYTLITAKIFDLAAGDYIETYVLDRDNDATIRAGETYTYMCVAKIA
ncbi:MAG: hypothetical protein DRP29_01970 [Thermodesulfobacteriota bacterium]|nr:MAG: hypothetical protein DRP29_01970 [Thermodesulfobacteriota bacterium]